MADGRHIENRFLAICRRHINRSTRNLEQRWRSNADISHVSKTAIFANSRWRTATILKIALSPYFSRELSDFDQVRQVDVHFNSHDGHLPKNSKFWKYNMADGRHIEIRFLPISRRHIGRSTRNLEQRWRITCRLRSRDQYCNFRKFNDDVITNPRWRTDAMLEIVFGYITAPYWPISAKFLSDMNNYMQM